MNRDLPRNFVAEILLLVALYVGSFYLLPQRWGGPYPFGPITWSSAFYNTVFYPMRRWTRTEIHQWDGWVERVDLEKRNLLIMTSPRHGYFLPYRWRDDAAIRELKVWDRIHVSVAYCRTCRRIRFIGSFAVMCVYLGKRMGIEGHAEFRLTHTLQT